MKLMKPRPFFSELVFLRDKGVFQEKLPGVGGPPAQLVFLLSRLALRE